MVSSYLVTCQQSPVKGIVQDVSPDGFSFADSDCIGMGGRLISVQGNMHTAQHHRHIPPAEMIGDLISTRRLLREYGDGHQIGRFLSGDRIEGVNFDQGLPMARVSSRQDRGSV